MPGYVTRVSLGFICIWVCVWHKLRTFCSGDDVASLFWRNACLIHKSITIVIHAFSPHLCTLHLHVPAHTFRSHCQHIHTHSHFHYHFHNTNNDNSNNGIWIYHAPVRKLPFQYLMEQLIYILQSVGLCCALRNSNVFTYSLTVYVIHEVVVCMCLKIATKVPLLTNCSSRPRLYSEAAEATVGNVFIFNINTSSNCVELEIDVDEIE